MKIDVIENRIKKQVKNWIICKSCLVIFLMICTVKHTLAAPVNDDPCGAMQLSVSNFCETTPFTCIGATPSVGYGNCGYAYQNNDVWFKVTVPASGQIVINTSAALDSYWGSYPASLMGVYSGSNCNSLTEIYDCLHSNDFSIMPNVTLSGRTPGETIWIRFWSFDPAAQCGICVAEPTAHPACGAGNPIAGNTACTATPVCNLNGYCTNTSSSFTIDTWPELSDAFQDFQNPSWDGRVIDNNSFIKFVASSSTVSLNVWTYNCVGTGEGIQFFIFSAANCSSGPVTPYMFKRYNANEEGVVTLMGLTPGSTYYIMFDGINGAVCDVVLSVLDVNTGVEVNPSDTTVCLGQPVNLKASGGNGTYNWSPSTGLSSASGANVVASTTSLGTLTYVVTSQSGNPNCPLSKTDTAEITVINCGPTVIASNNGPFCSSGTFNLIASSVPGAISYSWSGPLGFTSNIQNPINIPVPSVSGSYLYTVTVITNTATVTASTTLIVNPIPVSNAGPDQTVCGTNVSMAAVLSSSTNTGSWLQSVGTGITFSNSNSPTTAITANGSGVYTLVWTETAGVGCSSSDSVLITLNQPIIANAGLDTTICKGDSVVLTASGGTTYLWNGTVGGSSSSINVSPSVTTPYQVTVSGNGCSDTDEVIVHVNNTIANAGQDTSICIGTSAILHATGGSQYQWSNMQTTSSISVSPISDSTFYVTVTNNSCVGLDSVKVKVNPSPVANAGADQTICEGDTLQLIANGGGTYLWSGGLGTSQIISIQPASSITYTVTVTLNGCTDSDAINVTVNALPQITMSSISETCNMSNGYAISIVEGGSGIYNYIWNTGDLGPSIKGISQGIYTVTVEDTVTHCSSIGQVSVNHISGPDAYFVISNHTPLVDEESVSFTDYSTGSLTTWLWTIEGLTSKTSQNFNYVFETSDYYVVSLSIVDTNGCTDIYIDSLRVREGSTFYIPNAFSPNGDEDNESFGPEGDNISPEDYQMIILNRWGNVMFSTNNFAERWNGTKDNKGTFREAKEDVYVYQIRVRGEYNVIKEYVGKVILLK
ncbi:MAG: gliding motility-associated C-terminal domain-containing protein [Bacteroidota bacterium]